ECLIASLRLQEGPDAGEMIDLDVPERLGEGTLERGDSIVVVHYTNPEAVDAGVEYQFADRDRKPALIALIVVFAVAVVALGRLRGLAALAGLVASLAILLSFVLPSILEGNSPLLVAVTGASAIAFVALYAAHGINVRTTVALLGTIASLALTALLGTMFSGVARLTGLLSEEVPFLQLAAGRIDFEGIFLAGLVIGALGALDDMTVTQASVVWELRTAGLRDSRELFRSAMRVGRDHVSSTVNTLALAYAGASTTLLLLFVLSGERITQIGNGEIVATEIVRTLVGSIGLVASVPITTMLAVRLSAAPPEAEEPPETAPPADASPSPVE
ncbi:MAG TPA: YibE/F family protein, partial [Actinomycetota bacterium]|nr:YibE/F family protein [Actinomycetota bacterium]